LAYQENKPAPFFGDMACTYLADDNPAKADNHSLAGNLTAQHEAPALIEHFDELA
jgi:hypothetical protein